MRARSQRVPTGNGDRYRADSMVGSGDWLAALKWLDGLDANDRQASWPA